MTNTAQQVTNFLNAAKQYGFTVAVSGSIVRIKRSFTPNDKQAFCDCDMMASSVLDYVDAKASDSSVWGTDGGSIGGALAIKNGEFYMNKSGVKKNFMKELLKR